MLYGKLYRGFESLSLRTRRQNSVFHLCFLPHIIFDRVTKKGHDGKNILRSDQKSGDSIHYNDKLKLKHYMDVSNLHIRKDFEIKFANLDYKYELVERIKKRS